MIATIERIDAVFDLDGIVPRQPINGRYLALEKIQAYQMGLVREKLVDEGVIPEDQIDEAIAEFKRYFSLISLGYTGIGMMSKVVDEVWHTFILFTEEYADFCQEVFGRFIHHRPAVKSRPLSSGAGKRFFAAYKEVYGPIPQIWGLENAAGECAQCSDGCNDRCAPTTNCQDSDG